MSGLRTSVKYIVRNAYESKDYQLYSEDNDGISMDDGGNSDVSLWYLTSTPYNPYFRLHTPAKGDEKSLDVSDDKTSSDPRIYFTTTGDSPGQLWRLDDWGDGTYRLSNNLTGPEMHLDYSLESKYIYLDSGITTTQHWMFIKANPNAPDDVVSLSQAPATSVSAAETQTISTSLASTVSTSTIFSPASTSPHEKALSLGAIIGVAIGGLAALTLCICAVIYVLRRKRTKSVPTSAEQYDSPSAELSGSPPDYVTTIFEKEHVSTHVTPQGIRAQGYQEWRGNPPAEVVGSAVQHRVEMP